MSVWSAAAIGGLTVAVGFAIIAGLAALAYRAWKHHTRRRPSTAGQPQRPAPLPDEMPADLNAALDDAWRKLRPLYTEEDAR